MMTNLAGRKRLRRHKVNNTYLPKYLKQAIELKKKIQLAKCPHLFFLFSYYDFNMHLFKFSQ